jgi:hypothetical protein
LLSNEYCDTALQVVERMKSLKQNIAIVIAAACVLAGLFLTNYGLVFASSSNTVGGNVVVPNNCIIAISNTAINFGSVTPLGNAPVTNVVADTNDGNIKANILLDGTNWVYLSNSFGAWNTIWDFSSHASGVSVTTANELGLATGNLVDTANQIAIGQQIPIYFGVMANNGASQSAGTYTQTITIENGC